MTYPDSGNRTLFTAAAILLLAFLFVFAGGAALRESVTFDEVAHIGAGVSYLQRLDLRLNEEHPPLPKVLAAVPLVLRGARADYSHISWNISESFFQAFLGEWVFGHWLLMTWNDPFATLAWARFAMLLLALALGWTLYAFGSRLGGPRGGLLCLAVYVSTPTFLTFGPLVLTDVPIALFSVLALWTFAGMWRDPESSEHLVVRALLGGRAALEVHGGTAVPCAARVRHFHAMVSAARPAGDQTGIPYLASSPDQGNLDGESYMPP